MTAQTPDIIILNGEAFDLHTTPLGSYFERIKWRPRFLRRHTGNWRGHVARWEVFGERLFLTGLFGMGWMIPSHLHGKLAPDPDPFEPAQDGAKSLRLPDLFPDQAPLVFADWVTARLIVPTGPRLVYMHHGFGSLHATYRTIDVGGGRVRSMRDWDGREWARENGRVWPDDEWYKKNPQALVWPERNTEGDEVAPEDEVVDWRAEDDPSLRWLGYELAQTDALRRPCGQTPSEQPSLLADKHGHP